MAASSVNSQLPNGWKLIQPEENIQVDETVETFTELPKGFRIVNQERPQASRQDVIRNIARSGSRAVESVAGIPGDFQNLLSNVVEGIAVKAGADPEIASKASELAKGSGGLATSDEIESAAKFYSGDYLTPRGEGEKFSDEFIKFTAPLLIPTGGSAASGSRLVKTALKGIGATGVGKLVEDFSGSKSAGNLAQSGSYLLFSMFNPKGMNNYISSLYSKANEAVPKNASINPTKFTSNLLKLKSEISSSLSPSNAQKSVIKKIDETVGNISKSGRVSPKMVIDTKKSFNSDLENLLKDSASSDRKLIGRYTKRLSGISKEALREYGKGNPEFWKNYQAADEAFGAKSASEWISKNINKALEGKGGAKVGPLGAAVGHTVGALTAGALGASSKSLGAAAAPYYLSRFLYRYGKSPALRKYYNKLFKEGVKGNFKAIRDINDKIEKESESE